MKKDNHKFSYLYEDSILSIKLNLQFNEKYKSNKIIGITSSNLYENNESIIFSIAKEFAVDDFKTLILDMDLKNPKFKNHINLDKNNQSLSYNNEITEIDNRLIKVNNIDNLYILNSDYFKDDKIISSKYISSLVEELSKKFDYIFINIPPVSLDSSGLIVSNNCDGIIITVRTNSTKERELESTINCLKGINANIIGLILTDYDKSINPYRV